MPVYLMCTTVWGDFWGMGICTSNNYNRNLEITLDKNDRASTFIAILWYACIKLISCHTIVQLSKFLIPEKTDMSLRL